MLHDLPRCGERQDIVTMLQHSNIYETIRTGNSSQGTSIIIGAACLHVHKRGQRPKKIIMIYKRSMQHGTYIDNYLTDTKEN